MLNHLTNTLFYSIILKKNLKGGINMELKKNQYLLYKGLPLVRDGDMLCYGDLNEKYILTLNILGKDDKDVPNMIMVQICYTSDRNKIVKGKQAFKQDLYDALDLGSIWLEQLIKEDK